MLSACAETSVILDTLIVSCFTLMGIAGGKPIKSDAVKRLDLHTDAANRRRRMISAAERRIHLISVAREISQCTTWRDAGRRCDSLSVRISFTRFRASRASERPAARRHRQRPVQDNDSSSRRIYDWVYSLTQEYLSKPDPLARQTVYATARSLACQWGQNSWQCAWVCVAMRVGWNGACEKFEMWH